MLDEGKQALFNISLENGNFFAETFLFEKTCNFMMNVMFKK